MVQSDFTVFAPTIRGLRLNARARPHYNKCVWCAKLSESKPVWNRLKWVVNENIRRLHIRPVVKLSLGTKEIQKSCYVGSGESASRARLCWTS